MNNVGYLYFSLIIFALVCLWYIQSRLKHSTVETNKLLRDVYASISTLEIDIKTYTNNTIELEIDILMEYKASLHALLTSSHDVYIKNHVNPTTIRLMSNINTKVLFIDRSINNFLNIATK